MQPIVVTYLVYLAISVTLTIWVAQTLFKNGRVFLVEVFHGDNTLGDSVNRLLVVGFYLINLGYMSLMLKIGTKIDGAQDSIEALSTKVGMVLLILGAMHFFNLAVFNKLRNTKLNEARFASQHANLGAAPGVSRFRQSFGSLEE
ncbi:MAG: hypothetical protein H7145_18030 [Akkermansiaceae bacterium]|nr:hypothetical protein [Armatimonadota bacterium]